MLAASGRCPSRSSARERTTDADAGHREVSRRGKKAASNIGEGAIAVHLDVTDAASISAAAEQIRLEAGRLDLLINNAAVSGTRTDIQSFEELRASPTASGVPLEEVRAVWEVNVFGPLAVYQPWSPSKEQKPSRKPLVRSYEWLASALMDQPTPALRGTEQAFPGDPITTRQ
ncbi:SDR family NAD(P)-dependent oxidoreductase [Arthrobacter sp. Soc17.1.1.1]|uniref:SDR family NAD(P)-dependent oxidoreductase n=1 Tax=Arthrobacter sp. Soc17.1.1.1 TaxID=3121277 RepID=UPI003FA5B9DD